jgi:hypothetical protein
MGPSYTSQVPSASDSVPQRATYQVPDEACPSNYGTGLSVTTDTPAELQYVDDIVACTTVDGGATYLKNDSDAVWVLSNTGTIDGTAFRWDESLRMASFRSVFGSSQVLLVPAGVVTSTLPPSSLEWTIDLPLSLSWEAHEVVVDKIASLGETALIDALKRKSTAGAAIAQCAFTVHEYADGLSGLAEKDMSEVLLNGLGAGIATNKCRERAAEVGVLDSAEQRVALSTELDQLGSQTKLMETVEASLSRTQRAIRVLKLVRFLPRG